MLLIEILIFYHQKNYNTSKVYCQQQYFAFTDISLKNPSLSCDRTDVPIRPAKDKKQRPTDIVKPPLCCKDYGNL